MVLVEISKRCDKECGPCVSDSTIDGLQMEFSLLTSVAEQVRDAMNDELDIGVVISGGEPILYNYDGRRLYDIIKLFSDRDTYASFLTSGRTLDEETLFKDTLVELGGLARWHGCDISANNYLPGGPERTKLSIEDMVSCGFQKINVNLTADVKNFHESIISFVRDVCLPLGVKPPNKLFQKDGTLNIDYLIALHRNQNQPVVFTGVNYEVHLNIFSVGKGGRNRNLKYAPFTVNYECNVVDSQALDLFVSYEGDILPCCTAPMCTDKSLVIGTVRGGTIADIFQREEELIRVIQMRYEMVSETFAGNVPKGTYFDICNHCAKLT
ncbi:MAG: radical SAM protein [Nanoarchaeota archaeon]|nr:radical SAM protein [Nanoarchaeota archaeon]MBU1946192.1 radical SAM protein [Nanoarchaeota archaeon]